MPVFGVLARSWAMTMADPRMKENGDAIMREYRNGMRSGIRSLPVPPGGRSGPADRSPASTPPGRPWGPIDARRARVRDVAGNSGPPATPQVRGSGLARHSWLLLHNARIQRHRYSDNLASGVQGG